VTDQRPQLQINLNFQYSDQYAWQDIKLTTGTVTDQRRQLQINSNFQYSDQYARQDIKLITAQVLV
jgi:hypothetical protein